MNMDSKPLLFGLIGFFLGGLLVSVAATTFDKPESHAKGMTMAAMTAELRDKTGDAYDAAFLNSMIEHHEGAVAMAKLSEERAKHPEIKQLSEEIIGAQEREITQMRDWQIEWGFFEAQNVRHKESRH